MNQIAMEEAWLWSSEGLAEAVSTTDDLKKRSAQTPALVLVNRYAPDVEAFLSDHKLVPDELLKPLLMEDTRPRCESFKNGVLLNVRGINLNPGAEWGDMLSARMWITDEAVILLHAHPIMALREVVGRFSTVAGVDGIGAFIIELVEGLTMRISAEVQQLEEKMDELETQLDTQTDHRILLNNLAHLRPVIMTLKRFIAPQQEALSRLSISKASWLSDIERIHLRHNVDVVTRLVEDLESLRERATYFKDAIQQKMSDAMTRSMNWLSAVAFVFLPLGFITGLLGINVGGMPGVESPWAFTAVTLGITVLGFALWWLMHRKNLL